MRAGDLDLARKAQEKGWIADAELRSVLAESDRYQALGLEKGVDEILLERGLLVADQVKELREALGLSLKNPRIGDYEVIRRIGMGGMGTVFESRHVRLAQRIALKILQPRHARDPQTAERFLAEARTLARLNHPNLVHAMDAGKDGDLYYLAMELVAGENLLQIVLRDGPLEPRRSLAIVKDVCRALGALEEKGLVHRDVKPANILVGAGGKVQLADFGLLAAVDDGALEAGPLCGTPHYLAPEQAHRHGVIDHRSDLYSLAASWYHVLVGRPPFVGKSTREIVRGHLQQPPAPPSSLRPGIPRAMEALILRWLAKDKGQRPASCRAALAELEELERSLAPRPQGRLRLAGLAAAVALAVGLYVWRPWREPAPTPRIDPAPPADPIVAVEPPSQGSPATPEESAPAPELSVSVDPTEPAPRPAAGPPPEAAAALPPVLSLPSGNGRPLFLGWSEGLARGARRLRQDLTVQAAVLGVDPAAFRARRRLLSTFHATRAFLGPGAPPAFLVRLEYDFAAAAEERDFRWRPGAWRIESHGLRRTSAATPDTDGVTSIGWFAAPLRIEGVLSAGAPLVLGLGPLRIAPGSGGDAQVWLETTPDDPRPGALPETPPGAFWLAISSRAVEIAVGARVARMDAPEWAPGRLRIETRAGAVLESLAIEGLLDPVWAGARLEAAAAAPANPR